MPAAGVYQWRKSKMKKMCKKKKKKRGEKRKKMCVLSLQRNDETGPAIIYVSVT